MKPKIIYWVKGMGPMKMFEPPRSPQKTTATLIAPNGYQRYWANPSDLSPIIKNLLNTFITNLTARNLALENPPKWSKELDEQE